MLYAHVFMFSDISTLLWQAKPKVMNLGICRVSLQSGAIKPATIFSGTGQSYLAGKGNAGQINSSSAISLVDWFVHAEEAKQYVMYLEQMTEAPAKNERHSQESIGS